MISVEMMVARREAGDSLEKAATFAYSSTAFPMLTGTLVTVAGFVPIGLNGSSAGEYTFTLFAVITAALLISWVVAVLFTPLLGVTMLPRTVATAAGAAVASEDALRITGARQAIDLESERTVTSRRIQCGKREP